MAVAFDVGAFEYRAFETAQPLSAGLAASETTDNASVAATSRTTLALTVSEASDVSAVNTIASWSLSLNASEGVDYTTVDLFTPNGFFLSVSEPADVANGGMQIVAYPQVFATEAFDVSVVNIYATQNAALVVTEAQDIAASVATSRTVNTLAAQEVPDGTAINVRMSWDYYVSSGTISVASNPDFLIKGYVIDTVYNPPYPYTVTGYSVDMFDSNYSIVDTPVVYVPYETKVVYVPYENRTLLAARQFTL